MSFMQHLSSKKNTIAWSPYRAPSSSYSQQLTNAIYGYQCAQVASTTKLNKDTKATMAGRGASATKINRDTKATIAGRGASATKINKDTKSNAATQDTTGTKPNEATKTRAATRNTAATRNNTATRTNAATRSAAASKSRTAGTTYERKFVKKKDNVLNVDYRSHNLFAIIQQLEQDNNHLRRLSKFQINAITKYASEQRSLNKVLQLKIQKKNEQIRTLTEAVRSNENPKSMEKLQEMDARLQEKDLRIQDLELKAKNYKQLLQFEKKKFKDFRAMTAETMPEHSLSDAENIAVGSSKQHNGVPQASEVKNTVAANANKTLISKKKIHLIPKTVVTASKIWKPAMRANDLKTVKSQQCMMQRNDAKTKPRATKSDADVAVEKRKELQREQNKLAKEAIQVLDGALGMTTRIQEDISILREQVSQGCAIRMDFLKQLVIAVNKELEAQNKENSENESPSGDDSCEEDASGTD